MGVQEGREEGPGGGARAQVRMKRGRRGSRLGRGWSRGQILLQGDFPATTLALALAKGLKESVVLQGAPGGREPVAGRASEATVRTSPRATAGFQVSAARRAGRRGVSTGWGVPHSAMVWVPQLQRGGWVGALSP